MATYTQGYSTSKVADDATFRIRGKWFSDQLTAIGWGKTADTGQIDWTSVTKPVAGSTVAGYEIRKSSDGLTDIYIKLEYGSGQTATDFGFWITTGSASNGSGTISANASARQALACSGGTVACNDHLSGTAGRFSLAYAVVGAAGFTNVTPAFIIQRTTDASGVDTSTGFIVVADYFNGGKNWYTGFATGAATARAGVGFLLYGVAPIPGSASAVPVFPIYCATPSDFQLVRDAVIIPTAYAGGGSTHTISILGSNRTYLAAYGNGLTGYYETGNFLVTSSLCIRWE